MLFTQTYFLLTFINEPVCMKHINALQLCFFKDTKKNRYPYFNTCLYAYINLHTCTYKHLLIPLSFIMSWNHFSLTLLTIWATLCLTKAPLAAFIIQKRLSENLTINSEINISLTLACSIHCNTSVFSCVTDLSTGQCQDSAPRQNLQ